MCSLGRSEDESNQVFSNLGIREQSLVFKEHAHQIVALHLTLVSATLALLDVLHDLVLYGATIRTHFSKELSELEFDAEKNFQWTCNRVFQLPRECNDELKCHIADSLPHADFLISESTFSFVIEIEIKLVIIEVLTKTNMVYRMGKYTLKLHSNVNLCLTFFGDLS